MRNEQKFRNDLEIARKLEHYVGSVYTDNGWDVEYAPEERFSDWDLKVSKDSITETVEIKEDFSCKKTGNVCIEFECGYYKNGTWVRCGDSGVCAGDMNGYFMYVIRYDNKSEYFMARKKDIFDYCKLYSHKTVSSSEANSKCFLVKLELIKSRFNVKPFNKL